MDIMWVFKFKKNLKSKHGKKNRVVIKLDSLDSVRNNSSVVNQSHEKCNLKHIISQRTSVYSDEYILTP